MRLAPDAPRSRTPPDALVGRFALDSALWVAAWYAVLALVATWPLVRGLTVDLPSDLGDPLLNCWILGWDAEHFARFASGNLRALAGFWNANIFYPAPLALAYSEHLSAQAVQILPVYVLSRNLLLCYNLLFLSTFALSGLGVYLLVRELTAEPRAAFLAGLVFAFGPYRFSHLSHLQVLSAQWMPFVFYGLMRWFAGRGRRIGPLAGATVALVVQNLSCGYFLIFFTPFAAAFAAWELWRSRLWRSPGVLVRLGSAGVVAAAATWPFLRPYQALRAQGFGPRNLTEVRNLSADVLAYLTSSPDLHGWAGFVHAWRAPEGDLFPGFVMAGLAGMGLAMAWREARAGAGPDASGTSGSTRLGLRLSALRAMADSVGFWAIGAAAAVMLSLGPAVRVAGRALGPGPYWLLFRFVPGFDGLRVVARFGMIVTLMLSVLAGFGLWHAFRRTRRPGVLFGVLVAAVFLETWPAPMPTNRSPRLTDLFTPPRFVTTGPRVPRVYRFLRTVPADAVVLELPFGVESYEIRYLYYSTEHWRRLVNGYSGGYPAHYYDLLDAISHPITDWDRAWRAVARSGATLVVVHEGVYRGDQGRQVSGWLQTHGASLEATLAFDKVFRLPPASR
jgi:hypothetical protein